jgi:gliding motility-associated-like protein
VDIPAQPLIDATFDHTLLDNCEGGQFIGQAQGVGTADLIWNMGEGTVLEGNYADHQYTEAGEYEVMLVAVDPGGCGSDTASVTVEVVLPEPMQLSFDLEEVYQCGETTVNCVSTSPGDLVFIWWTSDNVSYYGPEMEHTFTEPGTYEIRFYGLDPLGCVEPDSIVVIVVVDPVEPVTAEFDLLADMDCNGTTVQATTTNNSTDLTYAWVMGDGNTYSVPEVIHLYDTPGSYSVQLTVTDNSGCNDPMTWTEDIEVQAPPYLVADFQMESVQTCGSMEVMLMNTSAGQPVDIIWDMGNGDELTGEAVAYTYEEPGTYTITLTINDPASCNLTDTESTTVTVDPLPVHEAAFELEQQAGCGELQIMATNTTVSDNADFLWIMGDGTTLSTADVSHLYTVGGNYTILLIVSDPAGCVPADTASAEVVVPESIPVAVDMAVEQIGGCESLEIQGTNMSAGATWQWLWSMGDGTQYDSFDVTHTYTTPGTYTVSLIANDTLCDQQAIQVVTVSVTDGVPVVLLSSPVLCNGGSVVLDASASPGIYTWSNGSTDHSITVDVPGTYSVTVDGVDGCSGTASVFVPPGQQFEFEETIQACPDKMVPLSVPMEGVAYAWSTGGMQQSEHVRGPGTYTFVVTDNDGCQHTGTYTVEALDAEAQLYAPNAFTPDGDGINDEFTIYGYGEEASRMAIYNRWGQLLYETTANPPTWDGMYNGSIVKQDVYVYQLEYRSVCTNAVVSTTGHVTVVK